jgi:hypothetical protein
MAEVGLFGRRTIRVDDDREVGDVPRERRLLATVGLPPIVFDAVGRASALGLAAIPQHVDLEMRRLLLERVEPFLSTPAYD